MYQTCSRPRRHRGFTLIELVVVIAVLGILAAVLIPSLNGYLLRAKESAALSFASNLKSALALLYTDWEAGLVEGASAPGESFQLLILLEDGEFEVINKDAGMQSDGALTSRLKELLPNRMSGWSAPNPLYVDHGTVMGVLLHTTEDERVLLRAMKYLAPGESYTMEEFDHERPEK